MHVWNVLHATRWQYKMQKLCKKSPSVHHCTMLSGYIFATEAFIDNRKNLLNSNISTCPGNMVNFREISWWVWGHHSQLQRVSLLGFITAPTSLGGGQPGFARCLAVSCTGTLCIHFGGSAPLTEFCQVQNSLCIQVLRSPTLAVSLHGTRAVCMSQTLWCGTRNGITELSLLITFNRGHAIYIPRAAITLGIGPQSSFCLTFFIDNWLLWTALCDHCICTRH